MTTTIGPRIGPCEVVSLLGAGVRGEVWRARSTRIKVVLEWFEELKEKVPTR